MPLRRGSTAFDALYRGSTAITAIYKGGEEIWPETPRIRVDLATIETEALDVVFVRQHIFGIDLATIETEALDVTFRTGVTLPVDLATIETTAFDVVLQPSTLSVDLATIEIAAFDVTFFATTGADLILTSGDMQSGSDAIALSGDESGNVLAVSYPQIILSVDLATVETESLDATLFVLEPLAPSGDMQAGGDVMIFSGDEAPGTLLTRR